MQKVAVVATIALDLLLVAAVVAWQWLERQPSAAPGFWQLPVILATFALASGAVALVACRRAHLVLLFLLDFVSVMVAAWLFQHLYQRVQLARMLSGS